LALGVPVADVNFVKLFAKSIDRLRRGEVSRLRLVGFAAANPERRALVHGLIEDHRHSLGPNTVTRALPTGEFEIASATTAGQVIEIDVTTAVTRSGAEG
jgi:hypothetical protein